MGLTAEKVAQQWQISREEQDAFAVQSNQRAARRLPPAPSVTRSPLHGAHPCARRGRHRAVSERICDTDEGPRGDATVQSLGKLKPVFAPVAR
jgi:acetyl-CoA acyltransferase